MNELPIHCTQIDISTGGGTTGQHLPAPASTGDLSQTHALLTTMVSLQRKTCELLAELQQTVSQQQRQRAAELKSWKEANPEIARSCHQAGEALSRVHTEFLRTIASEAAESADDFLDSDYALGEFIDRYGPRLAHFNGVMQLFSQLGAAPPRSEA